MTVNVFNMTDTWNDGGTVFTGLKLNVTNTASAAGSLLMDLQIGGISQFAVASQALRFDIASGGVENFSAASSYNAMGLSFAASPDQCSVFTTAGGFFGWYSADSGFSSVSNVDTRIFRDAANIVAQRNSTNAQTFRVYNTFTDASNYERAVFDWTTNANVLTIDVQAQGSGTQRVISLKHLDAATGSGTATFAATNCPATTLTSPYIWIKVTSSDGSIVYMPAWK